MQEPVQTEHLLLQPITPAHAADLWRVHRDPWVAQWADKLSTAEAAEFAATAAAGWSRDGVHKWVARDRRTGDLVGRGGLSKLTEGVQPTLAIAAVLGESGWSRDRLEVGWSIMAPYRGRGLAAEIGRAALGLAFGSLGASCVVAFTERHNVASRRVMEKTGMSHRGDIGWLGLVEGSTEPVANAPFVVYAADADQRLVAEADL